jgi:hypothetical protein
MSQPLRFKPVNPAHEMIYSPDGGWVSWEDYARLQAEVERLTKAGDAMAVALNLNDDVFDNHEKKLTQSDWNASKEGNSMWGVVTPYVVPPCIDKYTAKEGKQSK